MYLSGMDSAIKSTPLTEGKIFLTPRRKDAEFMIYQLPVSVSQRLNIETLALNEQKQSIHAQYLLGHWTFVIGRRTFWIIT
jgi:hypothetical protein